MPSVRRSSPTLKSMRWQIWYFSGCVILAGIATIVVWRSRAAQSDDVLALADARRAFAAARASAGPVTANKLVVPPPARIMPNQKKGAPVNLSANQVRQLRAFAMMRDPRWQQLELAAVRARLPLEYGNLCRELNLPGHAIQEFESAMVDHRARQMDIDAVGGEQEMGRDDRAIRELKEREDHRFAEAIRAILGDDGQKALLNYGQGEGDRWLADRLTSVLATSDEPLSFAQRSQLLQLLKETRPNMPMDAGGHREWSAVFQRAQPFLSPRQLLEFQTAAAIPQRSEAIGEIARRFKEWKAKSGL